MANVFATKTGNWSDATVWNTGSLPTVNDDVYANTFTVTIDQNITVLSLRTTSASGITAGGGFTFSGNHTVTANGTGLVPGTSACLTYTGTGTALVNANMQQSASTGAGANAFLKSGSGTITITGNILQLNSTTGFGNLVCNVTGAGVLNIIGDVGNLFSTSSSSNALLLNNSGITVNHVGNIYMSSGGNVALRFQAAATYNLTGNINGLPPSGTLQAVILNSGSGAVINITGNLYGACLYEQSGGPANAQIDVVGSVTATSVSPCIVMSGSGSVVKVNGIITNGQNIPGNSRIAILAYSVYLVPSTNNYWLFYTNNLQTQAINLYASGYVPDQPVEANVRSGISYGLGTLTGTLAVPSPANVRNGVPTDNTVGTANLTAQDFWDALTANLTTVGSIGKLLSERAAKIPDNPASVETTGDQLAALL